MIVGERCKIFSIVIFRLTEYTELFTLLANVPVKTEASCSFHFEVIRGMLRPLGNALGNCFSSPH